MAIRSQWIFPVILLSGATTCMLLSMMFNFMMIGEINRKKSDDEQISYFWHHTIKEIKIRKEYRRLYPNGRLHIYFSISSLLATVLMLLLLWQIGFLERT